MTTVTRLTRLIHSESGAYPLYLDSLRAYAPNTCFGPTVDSDCLIDFDIEVVHETEMPAGDVVTEGVPELVSGEWYQTWVSRSFSEVELAAKFQERKAELLAKADGLLESAFATGFPYTFPGGDVYHVQVREGDRGNISNLRTIAKEMIAENQPMTFHFRVLENIKVALSSEEMVDMVNQTFQKVVGAYQVSWDYKDAITTATTEADLPATPTAYFTL